MNKRIGIAVFLIQSILGLNAVPRDITDFFLIAKGNLTKISWAHAVNSQALLAEAFNSDIMMLEADVSLGKLISDNSARSKIPIMAHPPDTESDISLVEFIKKVQTFNENAEENSRRKGIKLDFKSTEAFEESYHILEENYLKMDFPVWMNADLLPGPLNPLGKPIDPSIFLPLSKRFENITVSIGWKTNFSHIIKAKYTKKHVEDMQNLIEEYAVEQPIAIPVRAALGTESFDELLSLMEALPADASVTMWQGKNDRINIEKLRELIKAFGIHRVSLDLSQKILDSLHLHTL